MNKLNFKELMDLQAKGNLGAICHLISRKLNEIIDYINAKENPCLNCATNFHASFGIPCLQGKSHEFEMKVEPVELPKEKKLDEMNTLELAELALNKIKEVEPHHRENLEKLFFGEPKETSLRDGESVLDKQLKSIEETFEKQERELAKLKFETLAKAQKNGIEQGLDKVYPDPLYPELENT